MTDVTAIYPKLPSAMGRLSYGVGPNPQSLAEVVSAGQPAGAETMLQQLLMIRGQVGGPEKAEAERQAPVREFHGAPIIEGGFSPQRTAPAHIIDLLA
jgi:hypothetical protein